MVQSTNKTQLIVGIMNLYVPKDVIFTVLALLIIAALVLAYGKANKPGHKWVSLLVFGLLLLGACCGDRYSDQFSSATNSQNITVRSSLGGLAARAVTLK
jgi:hypothetical protein